MMAEDFTQAQVGDALKGLDHFRVVAAQAAANEGPSDGIGGHHLLALGLRETGFAWKSGKGNVNNPSDTDHGCFQISELYHLEFLQSQPGCPEGTWRAVEGHTADETGYAPRFTPALSYALDFLQGSLRYAASKGVPEDERVAFAIASYNAGRGGAYQGWKEGDVDKYTTGGDYSAWVIRHSKYIYRWLKDHPNWRPE